MAVAILFLLCVTGVLIVTVSLVYASHSKSKEIELKKQEIELEKLRLASRQLPAPPSSRPESAKRLKEREEAGGIPCSPFYRETMLQISIKQREIEYKFSALCDVLDTIFPEFSLASSRYLLDFSNAKQQTLLLLEKAETVLNAYGAGSSPGQERKNMICSYLNSVDHILEKIDSIIDELIKVDLSQNAPAVKSLEESLQELQETTHYYS